jgi:FKBP-type peptidyl-prolyl cis-trans isomerase
MRLMLGLVCLTLVTGWSETPGSSQTLSGPKTWAVVVGIDEYVRPNIPKLRYAVADAKLFAQALREELKVPREQVILMTSDSVEETRQPRFVNVAYRLSSLRGKVRKEDTLLFYFAGHGVTVGGEPFLLTEEADTRNELTLKASSLHGGDLISTLRKMECGNVWVMLDACRVSPGGQEMERLNSQASAALSVANVGQFQSATMFSCEVGQRSWEWEEKKHGCYSYFLVAGLRGEAADRQGKVTLQGLADYLSREVPRASRLLGAVQNPTMFYGGPTATGWLLNQVLPELATIRGEARELQTDQWMARLEALQASLDQEVARRVKAEERAHLAESQRRVLEQQLAILEKQLLGQSKKPLTQSQADPLAYSEEPQSRALQTEMQRLRKENEELRQRLEALEREAGKLGLSRAVLIESQPLLGNLWDQAQRFEQENQAQSTLQAGLKTREALTQKVNVLKAVFRPRLEQSSASPGGELSALQSRLESEQLLNELYQSRYEAAYEALQEATYRLQEARQREQKYQLRIQELNLQLQSTQQELQQVKTQLAKVEAQLSQTQSLLQRAQSELQEALHKMKLKQELEERRKRISTSRSPEQRNYALRLEYLMEDQRGTDPREALDLPSDTVQVTTLRAGSGEPCRNGQKLQVKYVGKLVDGTVFDVSRETYFEFVLGSHQVIAGWEMGLVGMCPGELRRLVIPASLAYGAQGHPPLIPAQATLIFEVELIRLSD